MAGVTGGELTQRVVRIMTEAASAPLSGRRKTLLATLALVLCGLPLVAGILGARAVHAEDAGAPIRFEVFSIRQSRPGSPQGISWGTRPDGYSTRGQNLWQTIMLAYYPGDFYRWKHDAITNFPKASWSQTIYDIDGKIATADMGRWQKQGFAHELLSEALRQALQERCHLVAHREAQEHAVFALTLGRQAPKYEKFGGPQTVSNKTFPFREGWMIPGNSEVRFYGISMASLTDYLSDWSPRQIVDQTGLNGLYNITLIVLPRDAKPDLSAPPPPSSFDLEQSGFSLKSTKAMIPTIVIDHLEPPTPN